MCGVVVVREASPSRRRKSTFPRNGSDATRVANARSGAGRREGRDARASHALFAPAVRSWTMHRMFWPSGRTLRAPPPPRAIAMCPEVKDPLVFRDAIHGCVPIPRAAKRRSRWRTRAGTANAPARLTLDRVAKSRYAFSRLRGAVRLLCQERRLLPCFKPRIFWPKTLTENVLSLTTRTETSINCHVLSADRRHKNT